MRNGGRTDPGPARAAWAAARHPRTDLGARDNTPVESQVRPKALAAGGAWLRTVAVRAPSANPSLRATAEEPSVAARTTASRATCDSPLPALGDVTSEHAWASLPGPGGRPLPRRGAGGRQPGDTRVAPMRRGHEHSLSFWVKKVLAGDPDAVNRFRFSVLRMVPRTLTKGEVSNTRRATRRSEAPRQSASMDTEIRTMPSSRVAYRAGALRTTAEDRAGPRRWHAGATAPRA